MIKPGEAVGSETFSASIRPDKDEGGRLCGLAPGQFPEAQRPADGDERFRLADHGIQRGKLASVIVVMAGCQLGKHGR